MKLVCSLALILATFSAQAKAETTPAKPANCKVMIQSDPVNNPRVYDQTVLTVDLPADGATYYAVMSLDQKSAVQISAEAYQAYKADKFRAIAGQYVFAYLRNEQEDIAIAWGKADTESGSLSGGANNFSMKAEEMLVLPTGTIFGSSCKVGE